MQKLLFIGGGLLVLSVVFYLNNRREKESPISLDQLTQRYSDKCDQLIIDELKANPKLTYVSGLFTLTLEEKAVKIDAQVYFQKEDGSWMEKKSQDSWPTRALTDESLRELTKDKTIKYEVEEPDTHQLQSY